MSFDCIGAFKEQELLEPSHCTLSIPGKDLPLEGLVLLPGELRLVTQQGAKRLIVHSIQESSSSRFNTSVMPCIQ